MKNLLFLAFLFLSGALLAQNNEVSHNITDYSIFSSYTEVQNPLPKKYIYHEDLDKFIEVNPEPNFIAMQHNHLTNTTDVTGQWMGTSQTHTFNFMNRKFESTHIYDLNGVLRQSSVSFPLFKSKVKWINRY